MLKYFIKNRYINEKKISKKIQFKFAVVVDVKCASNCWTKIGLSVSDFEDSKVVFKDCKPQFVSTADVSKWILVEI